MLRLSGALLRRISYVTDVEGDFSYFQRFVSLSRILQWEDVMNASPTAASHHQPSKARKGTSVHGACGPNYTNGLPPWAPLQSPLVPLPTASDAATKISNTTSATHAASSACDSASYTPDVPSASTPSVESGITPHSAAHQQHQRSISEMMTPTRDPTYDHLIDVTRYRLSFRDPTSHFVFGGDAFDHGADLTFGHVLLDFKRRYPTRVHLLLGNRDVNKMSFYPRMARGVAGMEADAAEQSCFRLPPLSRDVVAAAALTKQVRYKDYLRQRRRQQQQQQREESAAASTRSARDVADPADEETLLADPVTFLQWSLKHKLGCQNAFEHRRQELEELDALRETLAHTSARADGSADTARAPPGRRVVSDDEVADSFFAAAQPGGIYYEYLRLGELTVNLDGVLFVHGGVNGSNAGFVPSLEATSYAEQLTAGEWWLPEVQPTLAAENKEHHNKSNDINSNETNSREENGKEEAEPAIESTTAAPSMPATPVVQRKPALEWLKALSTFKAAAFAEWARGTGLCGEALRAYVYPRAIAPHSVAVGTVMQLDGPHHICLPAAAYLIESGIHTVCGGHQPIGDTPAVVRQPGGFTIVDADTSYCGRGNPYCTFYNRRGAAVMELIFDSGDHDDALRDSDAAQPSSAGDAAEGTLLVHSLVAHGYRADATPFAFDLFDDLRVGRHVGDGWWVRLPPSATTSSSTAAMTEAHAGLYELHRTRDGFRTEDVRWATANEIDAMLRETAARGQAMVEGELAPRYTKAELAEVRVHRLKTKVTRTP